MSAESARESSPTASEWTYCLGVRAHAVRSISEQERAWLASGIERARRHVRRLRLATRSMAALLVLGAPLSFGLMYKPGEPAIRAILIYALLCVPGFVGLLSACAEALSSPRPVERWFFTLGLLAMLAAATQYGDPPIFGLTILIGPFVIVFGLVALFRRYERARTERRVLENAGRDLAEGKALELVGTPDLGFDPPSRITRTGLALKRGESERAFSVLPHSGLLLPGAGLRVDEWLALDVIRPAVLETAAVTAAVPGLIALDPKVELRQRHMTSAEVTELERHRRQLLVRAAMMFAIFSYLAARLAQGVELVLGRSDHGQVSGAGWAIAIVGGLAWTIPSLRLRKRLGIAIAFGKVLLFQGDKTYDESLAGDVLWTIDGAPAPWRTRKL